MREVDSIQKKNKETGEFNLENKIRNALTSREIFTMNDEYVKMLLFNAKFRGFGSKSSYIRYLIEKDNREILSQ